MKKYMTTVNMNNAGSIFRKLEYTVNKREKYIVDCRPVVENLRKKKKVSSDEFYVIIWFSFLIRCY